MDLPVNCLLVAFSEWHSGEKDHSPTLMLGGCESERSGCPMEQMSCGHQQLFFMQVNCDREDLVLLGPREIPNPLLLIRKERRIAFESVT